MLKIAALLVRRVLSEVLETVLGPGARGAVAQGVFRIIPGCDVSDV